MAYTIATIAGLIVGLVIFAYFWFIIPARMARKRGRSEVGWVLLGFCISPFWVYILLAILGETKEKIKQDIINEIRNEE
ncbi:MAG: hypothetical protein IJ000_04375 [Paludibacteraceae bacterium]|nr:hypothetical protein [Paludibacteraceae bacterium]